MLKTVETLIKKEKEKYRVPRKVQDVIPVQRIWNDGIFKTGKRYSKTFRFSDINYQTASEEDKERADHIGFVPSELQLPRALPGGREGREGRGQQGRGRPAQGQEDRVLHRLLRLPEAR